MKTFQTKPFILSVVMIVIGLVMITPFIFMLSASFKPAAMVTAEALKIIPGSLYLNNYVKVFSYPNFGHWYGNTLYVVLAIIALKLVFLTMAAYAFARLKFPFKNVLFILLFSVWMIPADTTLVSRYLFYRLLHLTDTHWAIILPGVFDVFTLFMLRQFFAQIPVELSEAAIMDGSKHVRILFTIVMPLSKPALMTMVLFTFIWTWNSFADPFIFITQEDMQLLTVGLQYFQSKGGSDIAAQLAGASLGVLPSIVFFTFAQRYFIQGISATGIKG